MLGDRSKLSMALCIGLLVSAGLNVALGVRAASQRAQLERGSGERQLMLGRRMSGLAGTDPSGSPTQVDFGIDGNPAVLYVFEPGCGWCDRNYEEVIALHARLSSTARFVGLSLKSEGLAEYLERRPLPFEVITGVDSELLAGYALAGTPRTLVIGSDGIIEMNLLGAWRGTMLERFEQACGNGAKERGGA